VRETGPVTWWTAIDTERVSDSGSSITVLVVSVSLVALGAALLGVTVWFWRLTRPDPDALGPLAVMSDRNFWRRGPIEQRRSLDAARPGMVAIAEPDVDDAAIEVTSEPEREIHTPELSLEPEPEPEVEPEPEPELEPELELELEPEPEPEPEPDDEIDEDAQPRLRSIDPLL
jgi:hypothetical protein